MAHRVARILGEVDGAWYAYNPGSEKDRGRISNVVVPSKISLSTREFAEHRDKGMPSSDGITIQFIKHPKTVTKMKGFVDKTEQDINEVYWS
jgi:N-acetylmuramoyl-L-alanine amidase CwlA